MKKSLLLLIVMGLPLWAGVVISGAKPPKVIVAGDAVPAVRMAANELSHFIGMALGVKIEQTALEDGGVCIYVGVKPDGKRVAEETFDSHIDVRGDGSVFIYGYDTGEGNLNDVGSMLNSVKCRGTLEATYTFLEDYIGARWLEPGEDGEYVPRRKSIELPVVSRTLSPTFKERRLYYFNALAVQQVAGKPSDADSYGKVSDILQWAIRLRYTSPNTRLNGCHTPHILSLDKVLFPNHPELFALQADGTRSWKDMCWSSEATKDFWWQLVDAYFQDKPLPYGVLLRWRPWQKDEFMIDPHDYGKDYFCKCPSCSAFIEKYGDNGFGECVFQTIVEVARKVEEKFPGKYITTLVYPPKKMYPESVVLPKNLRVRMTVNDLAFCSDQQIADKEIALMRRWEEQQGNKIALWMYILANFGMRLHGVPEFASTNFVHFLRRASKHADAVFYEHIEQNHTMRNLDTYLISHALWDLDYDIDAARREFFKIGYGEAADDMLAFYNRVEHNWDEVMKIQIAHPEERPHAVAHKLRKRVFNTIYTFEELEALQKMLDEAKAKVPGDSVAAKRIRRYSKYVMEIARQEFLVYSDDKVHAFKIHRPLFCIRIAAEPTEADWDAAPWIDMVNAKEGQEVSVRSLVKFLSSPTAFHVRARFDEPLIAQSRTTAEGDKKSTIWEDNETELFFASEKLGKVIQIGINDRGDAVIHDVDMHAFKMAGDAVKASAKRENGAWTLTASIANSLTGFSQEANDDMFNIVRARNVGTLPSEYHTMNPECILGHWQIPAYYSIVNRMVPQNPKTEYRGTGLPVSDGKTTVLVEDAVAGNKTWSNWVTPPGKAVFRRDEKVRHGSAPSYFIDLSQQDGNREYDASWRFELPSPPKGTRVRATAWVLVQTTYPSPCVSLTLNWLGANRLWFTKQNFEGNVRMPIKVNEWQKVTLETVVPDTDEIKYLSPVIGCVHLASGKLWIGEAKVEKVE